MRPPDLDRRHFLRLLAGAAWCATGKAGEIEISSALQRGAAFLASEQSADGAWRSAHYGFFSGGDALTPLVLFALGSAPRSTLEDQALERGGDWLDAFTDDIAGEESPWLKLGYPLFSASYAARHYASRGDGARAAVWADCIESLQLTASLGWTTDDPRHGAWSDARVPPRRPPGAAAVPDMLNPNLSATVFALLGLTAIGRLERARLAEHFILRCQNLTDSPEHRFDDGGFVFALGDSVRNKAGIAGRDSAGSERYRSYGSATCDGILALLAMGYTPDDRRVAAGLRWLRDRSDRFLHSGDWPAARADSGRALLFYYAQAAAQVLSRCGESWTAAARVILAEGLRDCQARDGSWSNADPESCEDDRLVASVFAVLALTS